MHCPSCGASLEVLPGAVEVVCPYCNTILLIQKDTIEAIGKQSPIVPFPTTFSIGKNFFAVEKNSSNDLLKNIKVEWYSEEDIYKNKISDRFVKVYISGHIRCMNDAGFWEKWFGWVVEDKKGIFENKNIMIQEDEGLITVFIIVDDFEVNNSEFENYYKNVGSVVNNYFVVESGVCKIDGIEGQFNYPIYGDQIEYVDLKRGKDHYLIEKVGNNILVFKSI